MADRDRRQAILALPIGELAAAIAAGRFASVEVLEAFCERAKEIDQACNAVTYWFEDCEAAARLADEHLRRTGTTLGPLHGVPFTIKDHVQARGSPVTLNMLTILQQNEARRKKGRATGPREDEPLVDVLRSLGAIPFAKTNMTQMGETWGGGGPAFGDTLNPWDTLRTPGGSSSGEGALVGGGASSFGIGSDVGGSLRIPSAFCGICTLKPTTGRMATLFSHPGDYSIPATTGIMAKSVDDVALVNGWLLSSRLFDQLPRLARIPFDHAEYSSTRKLRIGYYAEEYTEPKPCPTARRALEEVVEALRRSGHELLPFRPESEGTLPADELRGADWSFQISRRAPRAAAAAPAGARQAEATLPEADKLRAKVLPAWASKEEPIHPDLAANAGHHPGIKVKGMEFVSNEGVLGYLRLMDRRDSLRKRFHDHWQRAGLDALVCPAWALPACHVEEVRHLSKISATTRVFNFLDMPAGVVPVTRVTEADLSQPYEPGHPDPEVNRAAAKCLEGSEGLPMAVQVVAAPWREELVLRVMKEVQGSCSFRGGHAGLRPVPRRSPSMGARPEPIAQAEAGARARL
mmetsp:Transcript_5975/g.17134  ORF Transcript_5975/g.17134 Transcript_5975/m.17134 type:complete len:577 (+) Transcript_5975:84-1814(+)